MGKAGRTVGVTHTELGGGALDADALVEEVGVVGDDGVSGPLGEEADGDEDDEAVAVSGGPEEVQVVGCLLVLELHLDGVAGLAELELDGGVVAVAVAVVLGEDVERLVELVVGDEEAGGLGNPPDEHELDDGGERL